MNPDRTPSPARMRARWLALLATLGAGACGVTDLRAILLTSGESSGSVSSSSGSVSSGAVSSGSPSSGTDTMPASGAPSGDPGMLADGGKKGLAYGDNTIADLQALTVGSRGTDGTGGIWWWMNWTSFPDTSLGDAQTAIDTASMFGIEYVPMIFNVGSISAATSAATLKKQVPPNSKYLLTFNVANFTGAGFANVTPDVAAKQWPAIVAFANSYNPPLKIISPTVDRCTTNCVPGYMDPIVWLDVFLNDCSNCRIDFIGVRTHTCDFMTLVNDISNYENHGGGRQLWVNEMWCDPTDPTSGSDAGMTTEQYMPLALMALDSDPKVFRYAWYTGRGKGSVVPTDYDILEPEAGVLTPLGACYTQPYTQGYTQGACNVGSE